MAQLFTRVFITLGLILSLSIEHCEGLTKPSGIKLENNGYTGIVVAIHPDEPENPEIINNIKAMFTSASSYLYTATKKRAFFKEVTILIPETWSDDSSYGSPKNATFRGADVIIASYNPRFAPKGETSSKPYTKQFEGCGKQAAYIHITSFYLLRNQDFRAHYGDYGRVLVHEWGHYRWGLFNEYPDFTIDGNNATYFYYNASERIWKPVSCTSGWQFIPLKYTGNPRRKFKRCNGDERRGYEEGCFTSASRYQPHVSGSIMNSHLKFPQIVNFCDNETDDPSYLHNSEAPTQHNKLCDGRSNWEIMREHPDFKDNNNPPRVVDDVTPTFHVVRSRPDRVVLVLDTSGSMSSSDRHLKLADAARTYIMSIAPPGTFVGIVDFDGGYQIVSYLTELTSHQVRLSLSRAVPVDASGGTCIGCGMEGALQILTAGDGNADGSKIILMTDGQDGNTGYTESMTQQFIQNNILIDSIAISDSAEPNLIDLSTRTGGRFSLQTDNIHSTGIRDALAASVGESSESHRRVELSVDVTTLAAGETVRKTIYIDETLGKSNTFDFTYFARSGGTILDVVVKSPSNIIYDRSASTEYWEDLTFRKITIKFSNTVETGSWEYSLTNRLPTESYDVIASVSSFPSQQGVGPILVTSYLSGTETDFMKDKSFVAYAEVRQGFSPVINATVIATIERPGGTSVELELWDNGAGADITEHDGIYSRFVTQITGVGNYGLKISARNNGKAIVLRPSPSSRNSGIGVYFDPEPLLAGDLQSYENLNIPLVGAPLKILEGVPAPMFVRRISGEATRVSETVGWLPGVDTIAPNKITDLEVVDIDEGSVTLTFTSPGDDLDFGNAHHYVIQWANSSHMLRNSRMSCPTIEQHDVIEGNLSFPMSFGAVETFKFRTPLLQDADTWSLMIGVYAVDEVGNEGSTSNVRQATFRRHIPPSIDEEEATTGIFFDSTWATEMATETNDEWDIWSINILPPKYVWEWLADLGTSFPWFD